MDHMFNSYASVYGCALLAAGLVSLFDGLRAAQITFPTIDTVLLHLPLAAEGIGWALPAIIGAVIGYVYGSVKNKRM
jgi:LIVCS family branched-chain amino acid:cation transporter